ncbi:cellulose synthase A catalytic subunit 1 [UDP-forming]-like [Arachis duranensis]|uniref:Cellulose synthase A catalytic subunit 1 [UDP-forming]-like n=1 Tax=Arachis duranensis TaxID=130453 RepID=A0A9C6TWE6_ARADU|nr:cellulose synthase A catalytic subunit 1 [UDP-forming]-like [Arachis duranensis]
MSLLLAMSVHFQFVVLVMNTSKRIYQCCLQCKTRYKGSPRVDDVDDVDDLANELSYGQGKAKARPQWDEDADISSSSRHEQPIPLLTHRHQISRETATPDT